MPIALPSFAPLLHVIVFVDVFSPPLPGTL
jgi:hypothetical protein